MALGKDDQGQGQSTSGRRRWRAVVPLGPLSVALQAWAWTITAVVTAMPGLLLAVVYVLTGLGVDLPQAGLDVSLRGVAWSLGLALLLSFCLAQLSIAVRPGPLTLSPEDDQL